MSVRGSGSGPDRQPASGGPGRPGSPHRKVRQAVGWVLVAVALVGVPGAAWAVPEVRNVLKDSFTERTPSYVELYFRRDPWFDGDELVVPLAVHEQGDTGGRQEVKVWVQDADGERLATRTTTVTTKPGALIRTDVRLAVKKSKGDAGLVEVTLLGHPQRLRMHLR